MKEFKTEAITENLHSVLGFIDGQLELIGCPMKPQMQIDIAAEEIFVNIAHYAYTSGTGEATIRVELCRDPSGVEITFIDRGVPYDPLAKPDPDVTLSADSRKVGGLGIFMVKKSMDQMDYEYRDGQNILTFRKDL
jgi:anti-sigma regulatory factor (Ser/Thr protein kinase)